MYVVEREKELKQSTNGQRSAWKKKKKKKDFGRWRWSWEDNGRWVAAELAHKQVVKVLQVPVIKAEAHLSIDASSPARPSANSGTVYVAAGVKPLSIDVSGAP